MFKKLTLMRFLMMLSMMLSMFIWSAPFSSVEAHPGKWVTECRYVLDVSYTWVPDHCDCNKGKWVKKEKMVKKCKEVYKHNEHSSGRIGMNWCTDDTFGCYSD